MATPITVTKYKLRASSPIPSYDGPGCPAGGPPSKYILQSFGVEISEVDNWDSLVGLYGSEVMQGLQNFEDSDTFREHSYTRVSYNGTNNRDTDGNLIFRGAEEHTEKWADEEASGLVWIQ